MIGLALLALAPAAPDAAQRCHTLQTQAEISVSAADQESDIVTRKGLAVLERQTQLGPALLEAQKLECPWLKPLPEPRSFGFTARTGRSIKLTLGEGKYTIDLSARPKH